MIRRFLADAWSRLWRGEPLDVYLGPVDPPQKAIAAVAEEYARHQVEADEPTEDFGSEVEELIESVHGELESRVLERLAVLSKRMSPWDAAVELFGGTGGTAVNRAGRG